MALSVVQQHLFSYFNLLKVASLKTVLKAFEEILSSLSLTSSPVQERLTAEILKINKVIQKYDLEIVELTDEITCDKLFILINAADNVISQKSTFYDESTTRLFSEIVKDCILSEEGYVSETHCLNLNVQTKVTKSGAQTILEKLLKDKWLASTNDKISLGMRSLAELEQSIKQHYPENIKICPFCKLIVMQGYICHNCKIKTHIACWKKYFKVLKNKCACPGCKEIWTDVPSYMQFDNSFEKNGSSLTCNPPKRKKFSR